MANVNDIGSLQRIMVKPMAWRLLGQIDGTYRVQFTYVDPQRSEFCEVQTARGATKVYKTADAALADIAKVQAQAFIDARFAPA